MSIRDRILSKLDEALQPQKRVEIKAEEYTELKRKHSSSKVSENHRNSKYTYLRHKDTHEAIQPGSHEDVSTPKDKKYSVTQTHSHADHKLPSIEKDSNGKHWKYTI